MLGRGPMSEGPPDGGRVLGWPRHEGGACSRLKSNGDRVRVRLAHGAYGAMV